MILVCILPIRLLLFLQCIVPRQMIAGFNPLRRPRSLPSSIDQRIQKKGWMAAKFDDMGSEIGSNAITKGMDHIAVVQTGFGCCHGRNVTKATLRAIRNAIDNNSVKVRTIIPGGYDALKIHLQVGIPSRLDPIANRFVEDSVPSDPHTLDMAAVAAELPYGKLLPVQVQGGGMWASHSAYLAGMSPKSHKDDMTLAVVCVSMGYDDV